MYKQSTLPTVNSELLVWPPTPPKTFKSLHWVATLTLLLLVVILSCYLSKVQKESQFHMEKKEVYSTLLARVMNGEGLYDSIGNRAFIFEKPIEVKLGE